MPTPLTAEICATFVASTLTEDISSHPGPVATWTPWSERTGWWISSSLGHLSRAYRTGRNARAAGYDYSLDDDSPDRVAIGPIQRTADTITFGDISSMSATARAARNVVQVVICERARGTDINVDAYLDEDWPALTPTPAELAHIHAIAGWTPQWALMVLADQINQNR